MLRTLRCGSHSGQSKSARDAARLTRAAGLDDAKGMALLDRFRLTDRVALVTGAGRGIGRGIALAFAELGADVVCAARTEPEIEAVAEEARRFGRRAVAAPCDVTDATQLEDVARRVLTDFGRIDLLVNNAG